MVRSENRERSTEHLLALRIRRRKSGEEMRSRYNRRGENIRGSPVVLRPTESEEVVLPPILQRAAVSQ